MLAGAAALRRSGSPTGCRSAGCSTRTRRASSRARGGCARRRSPDPHWFDYPTLVLYLIAPFQAWEDAPSFLTAAIVDVVLGVAAVAATWWLGRRAYGTVAGVVAAAIAAVETVLVSYSRAAVTDVPLTLGVACSLAFGLGGRLELAGVAAGLADEREVARRVPARAARRRRAGAAGGGSPCRSRSRPRRSSRRARSSSSTRARPGATRRASSGSRATAGSGSSTTTRRRSRSSTGSGTGWGRCSLIALAGLVVALLARRRADLILASFVLVYFVDLVDAAGALRPLHAAARPAARRRSPGALRYLAPVTLAARSSCRSSGRSATTCRLTRTDTRVVAQRWIEGHVPHGERRRGRVVDAAAAGLPRAAARSCPARAGRPTRTATSRAPRARACGTSLVTGAVADRVLAARDHYPARGALLRRSSTGARGASTRSSRAAASPGLGFARLRCTLSAVRPGSPLSSPSSRPRAARLGCGGSGTPKRAGSAEEVAARASHCTGAVRASWQQLANRIHAPVYCPSWLPDPFTGKLDAGAGTTIDSVVEGPQLPDGLRLASRPAAASSTSTCAATPGGRRCRPATTPRSPAARRRARRCRASTTAQGTKRIGGRTRHDLHAEPGRRPVARPLRVALPRLAVHGQPARARAAHVRRRSSSR